MITALLSVLLVLTPIQSTGQISDVQKKDFLKLLNTLPHEGDFYTDTAIEKAGPYLPILFSLTEKDLANYDIYPFGALSRGLCDRKKHRDYAVNHFNDIQHPVLKLAWGSMLFDADVASSEIVQFLRNALRSPEQSKLLSEIIGPKFADFKRRVMSYSDRKP